MSDLTKIYRAYIQQLHKVINADDRQQRKLETATLNNIVYGIMYLLNGKDVELPKED